MDINTFTQKLAGWLRDRFLPKVFPNPSLQGFISGVASGTIASTLVQQYAAPLFQNGQLNLDDTQVQQLKQKLGHGFAVSKVLPFRLTPELIPQPYRLFVAPLFFDMNEPNPGIGIEFVPEDVDSIVEYFFGGATGEMKEVTL